MDAKLYKDSVRMLKRLRTELRGSVEDSVIGRLDRIIRDLEAFQLNPGDASANRVLQAIAAVLDKLPAVIDLLGLITKFMK